jgi:hypothetical protein
VLVPITLARSGDPDRERPELPAASPPNPQSTAQRPHRDSTHVVVDPVPGLATFLTVLAYNYW